MDPRRPIGAPRRLVNLDDLVGENGIVEIPLRRCPSPPLVIGGACNIDKGTEPGWASPETVEGF